ncbi:MAG: DUF58 domain-containing protein [Pseudomonadota bacterium]
MTLLDANTPAKGAQVDLQRLLALRFVARQFDTRKRQRALAQLAGSQRSNFRGRGIEFEEVRGYQPGDDIRAIDWRVTARTGTAHTKLFHEERERPVMLVVDQRAAMNFGSTNCFKSVLAAELCALLAWSALDKNERVGALLIREQGHWEMRPKNSRRNVLALLSALADDSTNSANAEFEDAHGASFLDGLRSLRRVARPGSSVFLISDFSGALEADVRREFFQLARHVEITAIHCSDPLEQHLPPADRYCVTDGKHRAELSTASRNLRQNYADDFAGRLESLRSDLQRLGVPLLEASTESVPLSLLRQFFGNN